MTNNISTKKIIIWMLVVILVGFLIGRFAFNMNGNNQAVTGNESNSELNLADNESDNVADKTMENGEMMETGKAHMADDKKMMDESDDDSTLDDSMDSDVAVSNQTGVYTDYDPALLANAEDGEVLLFFHASWCPSCRGLDKDIKANADDLPENVTILQVNYDTETELKKKYGVVRQHTLVRVDSNGNKIETLTGLTNSLDQVLRQI